VLGLNLPVSVEEALIVAAVVCLCVCACCSSFLFWREPVQLRDLSRVYEGMMLSTPDKFESPLSFVRLWRNECLRVFHDRLITDQDRTFVRDGLIGKFIKEAFPNESKGALADPLLFGDFRLAHVETEEPRVYEDLGQYQSITNVFSELLAAYNSGGEQNCLVADTLVATADGRSVAVQNIKAGDQLVGEGGRVVVAASNAVLRHVAPSSVNAPTLYELQTSRGAYTVTGDHRLTVHWCHSARPSPSLKSSAVSRGEYDHVLVSFWTVNAAGTLTEVKQTFPVQCTDDKPNSNDDSEESEEIGEFLTDSQEDLEAIKAYELARGVPRSTPAGRIATQCPVDGISFTAADAVRGTKAALIQHFKMVRDRLIEQSKTQVIRDGTLVDVNAASLFARAQSLLHQKDAKVAVAWAPLPSASVRKESTCFLGAVPVQIALQLASPLTAAVLDNVDSQLKVLCVDSSTAGLKTLELNPLDEELSRVGLRNALKLNARSIVACGWYAKYRWVHDAMQIGDEELVIISATPALAFGRVEGLLVNYVYQGQDRVVNVWFAPLPSQTHRLSELALALAAARGESEERVQMLLQKAAAALPRITSIAPVVSRGPTATYGINVVGERESDKRFALQSGILTHNSADVQEKKLDMVLFDDVLEHVTRILRIIRMPRGNALLVGVGGSGKQSLTRLAAYAAQYKVFQIQLTRTYGMPDFYEELKSLYTTLAAAPIVFMVTDSHIFDEAALEAINNMLTSGMVPALFKDEEKLPLIDSVRQEVKAKNILVNNQNCWNYFVQKCQDNLHVVLCMSPAGDALRKRCRSFPGMVSNTVIDWLTPWSRVALQMVASSFLQEEREVVDSDGSKTGEIVGLDLPGELRETIIEHMVGIHQSVAEYSVQFELELRRQNHVTPKNYLDYIHTYRAQLNSTRKQNVAEFHRLDHGLKKLIDAGEAVEAYGEELAERKIIVDQKQKEVSDMISQIKERSKDMEGKQQIAADRKTQLTEDNVRILYEKGEAEKALAEAEPELEAAAKALNNLKKEEIAEVKSMSSPPSAVVAVCQCYGEDTRILTDRGFLFISDIDGLKASERDLLRFACYDVKSSTIVYRTGTMVYPTNTTGTLVDFTPPNEARRWLDAEGASSSADDASADAKSNHLSLRVTPDHKMYVQSGKEYARHQVNTSEERAAQAVAAAHSGQSVEASAAAVQLHWDASYVKMSADEVVKQQLPVFRMLAVATAGATVQGTRLSAQDDVLASLGLSSSSQVDAFLELYGQQARTCTNLRRHFLSWAHADCRSHWCVSIRLLAGRWLHDVLERGAPLVQRLVVPPSPSVRPHVAATQAGRGWPRGRNRLAPVPEGVDHPHHRAQGELVRLLRWRVRSQLPQQPVL
jgi:hypothetical protein